MKGLVAYPEPGISKLLFASKPAALFWLVVRVYLGWLWLTAGWGKVINPNWVGENAGTYDVCLVDCSWRRLTRPSPRS